MRLLLTSGGVTNTRIRDGLVTLLGKPIEDCSALYIPTAQWGHPIARPESVLRWIHAPAPEGGLCSLGWRSVGLLELMALPSIPVSRWHSWVQSADVLLVAGGEAVFLAQWIRESGLQELIPSLVDTVWLGVSAGSMALTPRIGREFVARDPSGGDDGLGLVDFSIFPHLDYPGWPENTLDAARDWARRIEGRAFAIDDQCAISVHAGAVDIIGEGHWEQFGA
jgi:dipeptidase E